MKNAVQVTILGQQYSIKSDAPPEEVRRVARYVNDQLLRVVESRKTADTLHAAILALMNVAGAYLRLSDDDTEMNKRLNNLLDRVDAGVETQVP